MNNEKATAPTPPPDRSGSEEMASQEVFDTQENSDRPCNDESIIYLHGPRLWLNMALVSLLLFLTTIETFIATTSLVAITKDLGHFDTVSWVLSGYTLGYVAVIVIFAKLSDIFGRKLVTIGCIVCFTIFSGGCAAAQTMTQLIVLRGLQGLGGGGCFALSVILMIELVPPSRIGPVAARAGIAIVAAMVLGPIIGGAISDHTTWRWIFLINVPMGAVALALSFSIPDGFPFHGQPHRPAVSKWSKTTLGKIDVLGFFLLMAATVTFTAGFQEADGRYAWDSAYFITLLTLSITLWIGLLFWERRITINNSNIEPVLPWRFVKNRVIVGIMLGFLLVGCPMAVTTFQLPQRFQLVNGLDSFDAGIRLIPYGAAFPVGSMVSTNIANRFRVPAIYLVFVGSALQITGYALLSTLGSSTKIDVAVYGYEVLCGLGCGTTYQMLYIMIPFTVEFRDKAVGMGAANQFRWMGSAFGLAIATSVFNGYTSSRLSHLGITDVTTQYAAGGQELLSRAVQDEARQILSSGYNRQMFVLCAFAAAEIPVGMLMWKVEQVITA